MKNPHLDRALLLYSQQRHDLAEQELRQGLALDPDNPQAHAFLSLCLIKRKQYDEATDEAEHAIHSAPDYSFAHYVLATVMLERNRFAESMTSTKEAIRLDPYNPNYFAMLGHLHMLDQHWQDALTAAEHGLEVDAENVECNNLRAMALVKLGRKAEAGQTIDETLRRDPENANTHANQGWALLEQRQPEKAMEHFREALRLEPNNEWARHGIIEAMKAQYFVYGLMLRYFLWMGKLGARMGWGLMLGAYFGIQYLRQVSNRNPAWAPYLWPIFTAYFAFALMTWVSRPLFNLVLRTNRFGRLVLSPEETAQSTWIGLTLLTALSCAIMWLSTGSVMAQLGALMAAILVIPISGTYNCSPGWPRSVMALATVFLLAVGISIFAIPYLQISTPVVVKNYRSLFDIYFYGVLISSFGSNFLSGIRPKL